MTTIRLRRYIDPNGEPPLQETVLIIEGTSRDEFPSDDGGVAYWDYLRDLCARNGYTYRFHSKSTAQDVDMDVTVLGSESLATILGL